MSSSSATPLPDWMFEVHESDAWHEDEPPKSLLQELEVDPHHILKCIAYVFRAPFIRSQLTADKSYSNPFVLTDEDNHHDFWGPCLLVSIYALVLSLGRVNNVSWVYIIWILSSLAQHLVYRTWCADTTLALHLAISGYSLAPFIPISVFVVFFRPSILGALALTYLAIIWAFYAALKIHWQLSFCLSPESRKKIVLLVFPLLLTELYFSSLLPMIGWN